MRAFDCCVYASIPTLSGCSCFHCVTIIADHLCSHSTAVNRYRKFAEWPNFDVTSLTFLLNPLKRVLVSIEVCLNPPVFILSLSRLVLSLSRLILSSIEVVINSL